MIKQWVMMGLTASLLPFAGQAQAVEKEPSAEIEIGASGEWGPSSSFGPSAAIEYTVVKDWLEIEAELSPLFSKGQTEWGTELVFKKPFSLSENVEVIFGVGPEWLHKTGSGEHTDSIGGLAVLDFQFWPLPDRKFGWFLEPSYGYDFDRGHEQSLGVTLGLLIPIP